ncbi:MAG TPA: glycerophosphodiester phosphodiesterase family protein [Planctomycetota bacterium]|nr:glycerophosphodiester phosphodiesterase family protein [Planctomycetota bacterium]
MDPGRRFSTEVIAHRGFSAEAPENTLAALEAAIVCGADRVELDVQLTRDGVPIVFHDDTLERTTDGRGDVGAFTFAELRLLDAGSWHGPRFRGERVPSLDEALVLLGGRMAMNVELKRRAGEDRALPRLEEEVLLALERHSVDRSVIVSSFDALALQRVRRLRPDVVLETLHDEAGGPPGPAAIRAARAAGSSGINVSVEELEGAPGLVAEAHAAGLTIKVYTADDPERLERLLRLGVDGIFTNRPDVLLEIVRRPRVP